MTLRWVAQADNDGVWITNLEDHPQLRGELHRRFHNRLRVRLTTSISKYDIALTTAGIKEELQAMKDLGVYDDASTRGDNRLYLSEELPTMWVERSEGAEVRCRRVPKGCYQETTHLR